MDTELVAAFQAAQTAQVAGSPDLITPDFGFRAIGGRSSLLEQIFALRYRIYCLECGYLDPQDYPDGHETDEYDIGASHFTAHASDGLLAGAVRLVHPFGRQRFPFEAHCKQLFENRPRPHRDECAELSRLIVVKNYRRRPGDTIDGAAEEFTMGHLSKTPGADRERRNTSPQILLGLYRQMYQYSLQHGIRYWYAAMEKPLLRVVTRYGFEFTPLGPPSDYFGMVTPYISDLRALERSVTKASPALAAWFRGGHMQH